MAKKAGGPCVAAVTLGFALHLVLDAAEAATSGDHHWNVVKDVCDDLRLFKRFSCSGFNECEMEHAKSDGGIIFAKAEFLAFQSRLYVS